MTSADVITALGIPENARLDQRVAKKLLVENGAPTAADKRHINDSIEELLWIAALKPATIGVPAFRDDVREYLEIAVLSVALRAEAKNTRLLELIHRAIPYPIFLIQSDPKGLTLSLAHLRWSQGQQGKTVLDDAVVTAAVGGDTFLTHDFLASLSVSSQPRQHLHALDQGWVERFETYAASRHTGRFSPATESAAAERRRGALAEHQRLTREITNLRARAAKEKQINRRAEFNVQLKQLEARLSAASKHF